MRVVLGEKPDVSFQRDEVDPALALSALNPGKMLDLRSRKLGQPLERVADGHRFFMAQSSQVGDSVQAADCDGPETVLRHTKVASIEDPRSDGKPGSFEAPGHNLPLFRIKE